MARSESLLGFRIGVTADRRSEEQAAMLSRLGADVVSGPTIRTLPVADVEQLRELTADVIATPPDFLVANTALGIRTWVGLADTWGFDEALRTALAHSLVAARGPKAAAAAAVAGLDVWWRSPTEDLASVGQHLIEEGVTGRRVVLQLHGDDRQELGATLRRAGAEVVEMPVYRWTLPEDLGPASRLIEEAVAGRLDAVTFTAGPAVRNLLEIAARTGSEARLLDAFASGLVGACVGPVCARAATEVGIAHPVFPARWRLGPLVRLVGEELARSRWVFRAGPTEVVLQGSAVTVAGETRLLTPRELAVLLELLHTSGGLVSRRTLLQNVWRGAGRDPHVVDTTVGRLRAKLGPAGTAVETVVRRGYRLAVIADC